MNLHPDGLKKLLIQPAACNLALLMRALYGAGKPRAAHDRGGQLLFTILQIYSDLIALCPPERALLAAPAYEPTDANVVIETFFLASKNLGLDTGC